MSRKKNSAKSGAFTPGLPPVGWKLPYLRLTTLLVQRRDALGLTQEEAAPLIGVSRRTLQRWELGEVSPDGPTLFYWAACLGVEIASDVAFSKEAKDAMRSSLFGEKAAEDQQQPQGVSAEAAAEACSTFLGTRLRPEAFDQIRKDHQELFGIGSEAFPGLAADDQQSSANLQSDAIQQPSMDPRLAEALGAFLQDPSSRPQGSEFPCGEEN